TTAHTLRTSEVTEDRGAVLAVAVGETGHPMWCGFTAGLLSQSSSLFAMDDSRVVESTCQLRGDDRCTFEVSWDLTSAPETEAARRIAELEDQVAAITSRFEALQATATELVAAEDVADVLRKIISRAGFAVRAT